MFDNKNYYIMHGMSDGKFPLVVDDPDSVEKGDAFLADLVTYGPLAGGPGLLQRAFCMIGSQSRAPDLESVTVVNNLTAVARYADGQCYHIELLFDGQLVDNSSIKQLQRTRRDSVNNLIVVTDGPIDEKTKKEYKIFGNVHLVSLDNDLEIEEEEYVEISQ